MDTPSNQIICDGCGIAASPEHIAERLARLELATRYRPVHMEVLFVASAPLPGLQNDFYGPPDSREFFDTFLKSTGVFDSPAKAKGEEDRRERDTVKLVEFQRKGYYLTYLSECPIVDNDTIEAAIGRLSPTLVRRIRFNYRPKHIAILEDGLGPLTARLEEVGLGPLLLRNRGPWETSDIRGLDSTGGAGTFG